MEAALDRLLGAAEGVLAMLDALDGDPDLEPSLGAPERHPTVPRAPDGFIRYSGGVDPTQECWAQGARDEREDEHDGREPDVDDEYSLGWAEEESANARPGPLPFSMPSQEDEPLLGSLEGGNQQLWAPRTEGWQWDAEHQCEDEGHDSDRELDYADWG